jgi:hypothetical protein
LLVHQKYETEPLGMKYVQWYLAFESHSMRTTCNNLNNSAILKIKNSRNVSTVQQFMFSQLLSPDFKFVNANYNVLL